MNPRVYRAQSPSIRYTSRTSFGQPRDGTWKYAIPSAVSCSLRAVLEKPFFRDSGSSLTSTTVCTPASRRRPMNASTSSPSYPSVYKFVGFIGGRRVWCRWRSSVPISLHCTMRPNPSPKRSTNGRPPGPGWRYEAHFCQPGPGVLPPSPAYLER